MVSSLHRQAAVPQYLPAYVEPSQTSHPHQVHDVPAHHHPVRHAPPNPHPDPDPHPFHDVPHLSTHAVLHLLSPGLRPSLRPAAQPTVPQPELSANAAHYHTLCCPPVLRWPAPPTTTSPTSPPILSNQLRLHLVPLRVKPSPPCP